MSGGLVNLAMVRPWWLRLAIFMLIAGPLFGFSELHTDIHVEHMFQDLGQWTAYAVFVWLIVGLVVGLERLVIWLSVSAIFGLTVAVSGAIFRHLGVWDAIEHLLHAAQQSQPSLAMAEAELVLLLIRVMATLPIALLALQSFPASDILIRVARPGHVRGKEWWLGVAIFVRVFQHVFEVAGRMLLAWREENPQVLLPRFRADWDKGLMARLGVVGWLKTAIWAWSVALLQQALLFVPVAVRDWSRFADNSD